VDWITTIVKREPARASVKVLSWNIRHGGSRAQALGPAIMAHDPDVVVLCEYREKTRTLLEEMRFFGWAHAIASPVTGDTNGVAIVSKLPLDKRPAPFGDPPFAWWGIEAGVLPDLTVIGVYAPLEDSFASSPAIQRQFWDTIHRIAENRRHERLLLMGDFNTGATGTDCPVELPCADAFDHLSTLGWVDAWRSCNTNVTDFSYVHSASDETSNWRIDHAFVSPPLAGAVKRCWYSHAERERWASDHSILMLELMDR